MPNPGRRASAERPSDAGDPITLIWMAVQEDLPGLPNLEVDSERHGDASGGGVGGGGGGVGGGGGGGGGSVLRHLLLVRADEDEDVAAAQRSVRRYRGLLSGDFPTAEWIIVHSEVGLIAADCV
jgi:hypothetical protein